MTGLPDRLSALSPEQRALFTARLRSSGVGRLERETIPRRVPGSPAPLSFAQQRLWFLQRLEPSSAAYNIPSGTRLKGTLHPEALRWALQTIVDRHESLRTTFREVGEGPVQVVTEDFTLPLLLTDLSRFPEPETQARRLAEKEATTPFDLEQGPLIRAQLIRLDPQDHVLLLTVHHSVSDGWSTGVLMKELAVLYRSGIAGEPSPLPVLPLQYADYAVWQRSPQQTEKLARQLAYWMGRLAGAPPRLELPMRRRRRGPVGGAVRATLSLPKALTADLKALSLSENATLFMTLLAGFKVLLARYSGQEDILVGTPISGRTHLELEGLIGCFLNTLVLRTDLSGDPSFREVVSRVREIALGAYTNQELPFERLVEELQPTRDLAHN